MKYVKYSSLTKKEKDLIEKAFEAAEHSVSKNGHKVGCAILCKNENVFVGATNERSHTIGSTCAERMATDQLYFYGNRQPKFCVLVGTFKRKGWTENMACTPCGVCLEMFLEMTLDFEINDLNFLFPSWNKRKILKAKLSELYSQVNKVKHRRK